MSRRFSGTVNADDQETETFAVKQDATIEQVTVRFYQGPRLDLEVFPFVEDEEGRRRSLIEVYGRDAIVGDNDIFPFAVSEPVRREDVVGVEVTNNDTEHAYAYTVDVTLEREGGVSRGVLSYIKGVF
ncbi:hypothetical protein [Halopelagius inordinatus]|uniref:hypothetical protein n=1 Tax=Halopelagius inordinatus TaxID=553467 RepID=UPI000B85825F|nr:hypothetical protein [Halopelagius inordinatus]